MNLPTGRDIALVILIIEAFVLSLVPLTAFYFGIRGMQALRRKLDPLIPQTQMRLRRVAQTTQAVSQRAISPIIALSCLWARVRHTGRALAREMAPSGSGRRFGRGSPITTEEKAK